jgi:hypothetical protein
MKRWLLFLALVGCSQEPPDRIVVPTYSSGELGDAVLLTMTLPPFPAPWQTQGPDGSMTQLDGDLKRLNDTLYRGGTFADLEFGVRDRLRRQYPQYLLWATIQRIEAAAPSEGNRYEKFLWWTRTYGDPWREYVNRARWFTTIAEVTRTP